MTPLIVDCTIHHLTSLGQMHMFSWREWIYLHVHANVAISFSRILLPTTTNYRSLTSFLLYYCCSVNVFQNDNKMRVIQSLIVHDAIGKPMYPSLISFFLPPISAFISVLQNLQWAGFRIRCQCEVWANMLAAFPQPSPTCRVSETSETYKIILFPWRYTRPFWLQTADQY